MGFPTSDRALRAVTSDDVDDDLRVRLDATGGITIKAVTPDGDPVELSSEQARRLAHVLIQLAAQDDE